MSIGSGSDEVTWTQDDSGSDGGTKMITVWETGIDVKKINVVIDAD